VAFFSFTSTRMDKVHSRDNPANFGEKRANFLGPTLKASEVALHKKSAGLTKS
jgi:hypothetical protein